MSQQKLPPEVQQTLISYQTLRETYAKLEAELKIVESELAEIEQILSNIKDLPEDAEIYKLVGHVMVKKKKEDMTKELEEKKELLEIKKTKYKNQLDILAKQISDTESKLKELLSKYGMSVGR